jgi:polysaccharide biosynthesis transport protein
VGSVHAALHLGNVDEPPRVVQVTSAVPAEGKTVFAVSLAASLVQAGRRTLLLDLDLRHPSVTREVAGAEGDRLIPYLMGEARLEDLVTRDEASGLDIVCLRRTPRNPPALLGSQRLRSLIEDLRRRYDHVVIDSAPILGMRDSKLVAGLADATLLLVRWERTTHDAVADALKELADIKAPLAGVVIAQVDVERHARYGYGGIDGYYSKYKYYYTD